MHNNSNGEEEERKSNDKNEHESKKTFTSGWEGSRLRQSLRKGSVPFLQSSTAKQRSLSKYLLIISVCY